MHEFYLKFIPPRHERNFYHFMFASCTSSRTMYSTKKWNRNRNMKNAAIFGKLNTHSCEHQQNEKVFSIKRRLAVIWPKSPYICKTHLDHAHLHNAKNWLRPFKLIRFPFIDFAQSSSYRLLCSALLGAVLLCLLLHWQRSQVLWDLCFFRIICSQFSTIQYGLIS